jgi:hypothetical protein
MTLYCQLTGNALTDPTGRIADIPVALPRTGDAEIQLTWTNTEGPWRITRTDPAFPNFGELLSYSAGPYDGFKLGSDGSGLSTPIVPENVDDALTNTSDMATMTDLSIIEAESLTMENSL